MKNHRDDEDKGANRLDLNLHKSHLYNSFAPFLVKITRTEQINQETLLIGTVVEVHHVMVIQTETFSHEIDIVCILEMTELLIPRNLTDQVMKNIDKIHALNVHHTDLLSDCHIDKNPALDIDHVHTPVTDSFCSTLRQIDVLLDQDILDLSDLDHFLKQEIK